MISGQLAASACICFKLIETGDLSNIDDIRKYMEHTHNIGELAQVNTTSSVMQYDHAIGGVGLGDDDAHLARFYLEKFNGASHSTGLNNQPVTRPGRNINVRRDIICKEWRTSTGCSYGSSCRFLHEIYMHRMSSHPHYMHNSTANAPLPSSGHRGGVHAATSCTVYATGVSEQNYGSAWSWLH